MQAILPTIKQPQQLKELSAEQLEQLAGELRQTIIHRVAQNGGHLASSLGVVELTVALHRTFDSPRDKIIWDVGHQAYAHKLLTGRQEAFATLRQLDGLSGFPKRSESPHDCFDVGHSSTSISAALGMAVARDARGGDEKIAAVIGDGSLTGGLALEALNQAGHLDRDMTLILNDNEMSISPNVGALSSFLSRKLTSRFFTRFKKETENFLNSVPRFGKDLVQLAKRTEDTFKAFITPGMLFEAFGIDYIGPIDGHDLSDLLEALENASRLQGPTLIHVVTRKGKGFAPAEEQPAAFHGVGPFDPASGRIAASQGPPSYTKVFGDTLVDLGRQDPRIVAITAAMCHGTGLNDFAEQFPERFYDVGIAEQHAVTFAAGLAAAGARPVVAIYSTFLQRAYDNILHDVCLQNLPVTLALDRGGLVGADGPTHHGVFDYSYLRHLPNMTVAVPRDEGQLQRALATATCHDGPMALRYPRGKGQGVALQQAPEPLSLGASETLRSGPDGAIIALGSCVEPALAAAAMLEAEGLYVTVVDAVFLKPLDRPRLVELAQQHSLLVTVEENVLAGGFGSAVLELLAAEGVLPDILTLGLPDRFIEAGTQDQLRQRYGLDRNGIYRHIQERLQGQPARISTGT